MPGVVSDDERIESGTGSSERPERPRNLSAAYLKQAVDSLHAAGDPEVLFRRNRVPPAG